MKQVGLQFDKALNKDTSVDDSERCLCFLTVASIHIVALGVPG